MKKLKPFSTAQLTWLALFALLIYYSLFFLQKFDFVTSDLGRHLTNGRLILAARSIPQTNLYSYTFPNFPTVMHHWGAGVFYYLIFQLGSFTLLGLVSAATYLATLILSFRLARKHAPPPLILFTATLSLPLIVSRPAIRPESFSYLFLILQATLLHSFYSQSKPTQSILAIPVIQLLWVNTHILFPLGIMLQALFLFASAIKPNPIKIKLQLLVFLLSLFACLVNPYFIQGALIPFQIVTQIQKQYVMENLDVFTFLRHQEGSDFAQSILLFVAFLALTLKTRRQLPPELLPLVALTLILGISGLVMVRNIALFGYLFLISGSWVLSRWFTHSASSPKLSRFFLVASLLLILLGSQVKGHYYGVNLKYLGFGPLDGQLQTAQFLTSSSAIKSPIFNNFDIGGFLIYNLYPQHQVFTDNRPEAYPESFFTQTYFPIQTDPFLWQQALSNYNFQTIIVSYHDFTAHLDTFLQARKTDPQWQLIYLDDYIIVFSRV